MMILISVLLAMLLITSIFSFYNNQFVVCNNYETHRKTVNYLEKQIFDLECSIKDKDFTIQALTGRKLSRDLVIGIGGIRVLPEGYEEKVWASNESKPSPETH